ncbi:hypothetical protein KGA66_07635 [Actinocrinis puniceicyclus]|uniref:Uncharacterized protein n=1 Tax=Actinocrinis puniceicyclus TaxID=977794 RepID=A0A8J7WN62_9ACTN|nr:hypothetical protein [Actinocrinis puniceicyclus]MBS2962909.1 hypothetical protein [Actinocrinis puniceicyclus]
MTRTMYDGVDASLLPTSAELVGGYVDGLYRWSAANWTRFPDAVKVRIAVFPTTNDGHVLDVEPGNATPAESVDWVLMRRHAGVDPTVYMSYSTWPQLRSAFQARGVAEPHYWVALYDGVATIPAGAVAKQYYNNNQLGYDLSVVADHWPGVDPSPIAVPTARVRRNDMHVDLKLNTPVVFTNPAAALGGQAIMLLASDFGTANVRVATYSFKTEGWSVSEHEITSTGAALSLPLPADTNKVSVVVTAGDFPVGLDVLA